MKGKVIYQDKPKNIKIKEFQLPTEIGVNDVLLEVIQTNVCGSDLHVFNGDHPLVKKGVLGHEMVGRVVQKGSNVSVDNAGNPIKIGDRVVPVYYATCNRCGPCLAGHLHHCERAFAYMGKADESPHFHGTFSTHYYVHHDQYYFKVPDGVSDAAASSANCALSTIIYGLDKINLKHGKTIVIQGAGGLGLNACAVAKEKGATVVIVDSIPSRLKLAKEFGADIIIDMNEYDTVEKRTERIKEITEGKGADFGLEVAGVPAAFSEGIHLVKENGTYIAMGNISIGKFTSFDPGLLIRKSITILPINRYNPEYLWYSLQFLERNKDNYPFEKLVDATFDFAIDEVDSALEKSLNREVERATIVVNQ